MTQLTAYASADRPELEEFLGTPPGLHLYLLSRLTAWDRGQGFVFRRASRILGFAWFGDGRNLVFAGEDEEFLRELAALGRERERGWEMMVAPHGPATDFLDLYLAMSSRRPRLDRTQHHYVLRKKTLGPGGEPRLAPSREENLDELVPAAARMSAEDFEIDPLRISRAAVHANMLAKVREGRSWMLEEEGRLAFKVDLAVLHPAGAQVVGVFTPEDQRGRGIASRCLAELGRRLLEELPLLCLHVAAANTPARRAYENAGFKQEAKLRLTILTGLIACP